MWSDTTLLLKNGAVLLGGTDCNDPDGEEGYRGPHGIYLTNCENITLRGYTAQHNGNFMHQLDNCVNTVMEDVTCLGGSDGIHLHCCRDTRIENCTFRTGDDCIAGINVEDLLVKNCYINTSCNFFRIGGSRITVEDCEMRGIGSRSCGPDLPKEYEIPREGSNTFRFAF